MKSSKLKPPVDGKRVVTITISMPRRLLRQINQLRRMYSYPTMSEYIRERLQADLRIGGGHRAGGAGEPAVTSLPANSNPV